MSKTFGKRSSKRLSTVHVDLQKIATLVISRTNIDFSITEGARSVERQKKLFDKGLTTKDGINNVGKHNLTPAEAIDIAIYHKDTAFKYRVLFDPAHLAYVAGIFWSCALELYEKGEIEHVIRWGGNWDSDGVIKYDQSFLDMPHLELIKPKT